MRGWTKPGYNIYMEMLQWNPLNNYHILIKFFFKNYFKHKENYPVYNDWIFGEEFDYT
jgi:hypothetical protein